MDRIEQRGERGEESVCRGGRRSIIFTPDWPIEAGTASSWRFTVESAGTEVYLCVIGVSTISTARSRTKKAL